MPAGDIYQLQLEQLYQGQKCILSFHYGTIGAGTNSAAELVTAFTSSVLAPIHAIQSAQATDIRITAKNLSDVTDFSQANSGGAGGAVGDYEASFIAWGFIYNRATRATHNGYKRIVGVLSAAVVDGVPASGEVAALDTCALALGTTLIGGSGVNYYPAIYKLPVPPSVVGIAYAVASVQFSRVTTQNSRKTGRGV